jgi:hypothetical protein
VYVFFNLVIMDLCVLPRAPAVTVNNGSTFQPFAFDGIYESLVFSCFLLDFI